MVSAPLPLPILGEPFFLCKYKRGVCYFEYFNGRFYKGKPTIRTHDNLRGTWHICDKKSILSKKNRICLNIQCSYLYQPIHEIWLTKVATPTHTNFFTLPSSYPSVPFFFFFMFLELKGLVSILLVVTVSWISWILLIVLEFFWCLKCIAKKQLFQPFYELVLEF